MDFRMTRDLAAFGRERKERRGRTWRFGGPPHLIRFGPEDGIVDAQLFLPHL